MELNSTTFVNGSVPRDLLKYQKLTAFFRGEISRNPDNIIVIVPPHLKGIRFKEYEGKLNILVVPGQTAHEFHLSALFTVLGFLEEVLSTSKNALIIVQAAVLAPAIAILLDTIKERFPALESVRFFDLGRVLDAANPSILEKWPSTKFYSKTEDFLNLKNIVDCDPERKIAVSGTYFCSREKNNGDC